jgi:hypothetical protein
MQTCRRCERSGHVARTCKQAAPESGGNSDGKRKVTLLKDDKRHKKANLAVSDATGTASASASAASSTTKEAHAFMMTVADSRKRKTSPSAVAGTAQAPRADGQDIDMIVDSGCSAHMFGTLRPTQCENLREASHVVRTADGNTSPATAIGDYGPISDVLLVPGFQQNLFSVSQVCKKFGYTVVFDSSSVKVCPADSVTLTADPILSGNLNSDDLYTITLSSSKPRQHLALTSDIVPANKYTLWHQRLGHACHRTMTNMMFGTKGRETSAVSGMSFTKAAQKEHKCSGLCRGCMLGKMTRRRQPKLSTSLRPAETYPGRLVFADVLFSPIESVQSKRTCALLLCDADTSYLWVYFMSSKAEAPAKLAEWIGWMNANGKPVEGRTTLRTDNGGEFVSEDVSELLGKSGIKKEVCSPYDHVQAVERQIRSVKTMARSMLLAANVKPGFWVDAVATAVFTLNRLTTSKHAQRTRYELFHGTIPDVSHLRTFGCQAYVAAPPPTAPTSVQWKDKSYECRFIGYDPESPKSWRFWCPSQHKYLTSASAVFDENLYHLTQQHADISPGALECPPTEIDANRKVIREDLFLDPAPVSHIGPAPFSYEDMLLDFEEPDVELEPSALAGGGSAAGGASSSSRAAPILTRTPSDPQPIEPIPTRASSRQHKPNSSIFGDEWCNFSAFLGSTMPDPQSPHSIPVPSSYRQATAATNPHYHDWNEAIQAEIASLEKNRTFTIMKRPSRIRCLGLKWVFKVKENQDGSLARFKARCTALGNLQREGFDYDETFSPVVRYSTVRTLLAVAARRDLRVHQMDVDTAFLYGVMTEEPDIYVQVPDGYPIPEDLKDIPREELVARVDKAIYGLKQSPRLWNQHIDATMQARGFTKSSFDPCLYHRKNRYGEVYVTVYVDDLIIAASSQHLIDQFKDELKDVYSMKDLGELKYCLGMEVSHDWSKHIITVKQTKYIHDVLRRFGMLDCKPVTLPMDPGLKLSRSMAPSSPDEVQQAAQFPYREIVGSLMYLMITSRPDIAYAVGQLAMYMNCHGPQHHAAARHVLRYLHGT